MYNPRSYTEELITLANLSVKTKRFWQRKLSATFNLSLENKEVIYLLVYPKELPFLNSLPKEQLDILTAKQGFMESNLSLGEIVPLLAKQSGQDIAETQENVSFWSKKLGLNEIYQQVAFHKLSPHNKILVGLIKSLITKSSGVVVEGSECSKELLQALRWYSEQNNRVSIFACSELLEIVSEFDSFVLIDADGLSFQGNSREFLHRYCPEIMLELQFEETVSAEQLAKLGKIIKQTAWTAVLSIPRQEEGRISAKILEELPVKNIVRKEFPIDQIISRRNSL